MKSTSNLNFSLRKRLRETVASLDTRFVSFCRSAGFCVDEAIPTEIAMQRHAANRISDNKANVVFIGFEAD